MQPLTSATSTDVQITFGIMSVTVALHSAVGEGESLTMVCPNTKDHPTTAVKQTYVCPECKHTSSNQYGFGRARKVGDSLVAVPAEVLAAAKEEAAEYKKVIDLTVHPASEVTGMLLPSGKSYYLSIKKPTTGASRVYTLLARLVQARPDLAFMTKHTLRSALGIFRLTTAGDGTLVLQQMSDAALVREHPVLTHVDPDAKQLQLAHDLADLLCTPFVETEHTGQSDEVDQYVAAHAPSADVIPLVAPDADGFESLTASLEAMLTAGRKTKRKGKKAVAS